MRLSVQKRSVWALITIAINPVMGAAFSLLSLVSRSKPNHAALSFSVAVIYAYLPVSWDARNNFVRIYDYSESGLNLYTGSILAITSTTGIPYIVMLALFSSAIIYLFSRIIFGKLYQRPDYSNLRYFVCLALFLACLEYRAITDIQKTTLALAVVLLAIDAKSTTIRATLLLLSASIHPFTILFVALILFAHLTQKSGRPVLFLLLGVTTVIGVILTPERTVSIVSAVLSVSDRVAAYLALSTSRFSSDTVALLVWALRVAALLVISTACINQRNTITDKRHRYLLNLLVGLCMLALLFSQNEVFLERFFLAVTIFTAYLVVQIKFKMNRLLLMSAAILVNVGMHGAYTLQVIHSERYQIIGSKSERIQMSLKPIYYPTPLLLYVEGSGYSNDVIRQRMN